MNRTPTILILVAIALAAFAGCSGDEASNPTDTGRLRAPAPVFSTARIVGPSEIVLCVDVSDSVSSEELQSEVGELLGCLGDVSLFPSNGDVALSVWVYGDTIAPVVEALTAVTPTSVMDVFEPALNGLLSDRLVDGGSADLFRALTAAGDVLAAGLANDHQVLIAGSGEAADAQAATDACTALAGAGVLVSAIGVDPIPTGETLLMDCVDAGMGIYVASGGEGSACQQALSWMLVVELMVEPDTAELARGEEHHVDARVFRAGDAERYPEVGLEVSFSIAEGPNAGLASSALTDTAGLTSWAYTGEGGAGTDVIVTTVDHPQTGMALVDTVTVDWLNTAPECDAGGPYTVTVEDEMASIQLDGSASSDADGDTLSYTWSVECEGAGFDDPNAVMPTLTITGDCLCASELVVMLTVSDGMDESSCETVVELDEARPPVLMPGEPYELWPPNHKYHRITPEMMLVDAEDACGNPLDLSDVVVVEVRSDEPDDCTGDGSTVDDILIDCPNELRLRAERRGGGDGRVYTIVYRISDGDGNVTDAEATVYVPHDQGHGMAGGADDGGYTVTPECSGD